jgi:hypothetical protein
MENDDLPFQLKLKDGMIDGLPPYAQAETSQWLKNVERLIHQELMVRDHVYRSGYGVWKKMKGIKG